MGGTSSIRGPLEQDGIQKEYRRTVEGKQLTLVGYEVYAVVVLACPPNRCDHVAVAR